MVLPPGETALTRESEQATKQSFPVIAARRDGLKGKRSSRMDKNGRKAEMMPCATERNGVTEVIDRPSFP
jgi:hypothetical protein